MAKVAMILGPEFEDSELRIPLDRLRRAGHDVEILGRRAGELVVGKRGREKIRVQAAAGDRDPANYHAMVIPGGHSPDHLRSDKKVVAFVKKFVATGRPVAAVCHGPQLLIEADAVHNMRMTSWPSVRKDLENAGAKWVDHEVVIDGPFITSRKPDDLDAFASAILERLR